MFLTPFVNLPISFNQHICPWCLFRLASLFGKCNYFILFIIILLLHFSAGMPVPTLNFPRMCKFLVVTDDATISSLTGVLCRHQ